jgi:hypothetical protein
LVIFVSYLEYNVEVKGVFNVQNVIWVKVPPARLVLIILVAFTLWPHMALPV